MKEQSILNIISYGLEGNAHAVSAYAEALKNELLEKGDEQLAEKISYTITQPRSISPFMKGWWNCFSSFAEEILAVGTTGSDCEDSCINTLTAAGITAEEAENWLNTEEAELCKRTAGIVERYLETL